MHSIEAIEPVSRIEALDELSALEDLAAEPVEPVDQPYATWASMPTTYDAYPAAFDATTLGIAAAATAQHLKVFSQGLPSRDRKRRP
jgi:hypothetical protein